MKKRDVKIVSFLIVLIIISILLLFLIKNKEINFRDNINKSYDTQDESLKNPQDDYSNTLTNDSKNSKNPDSDGGSGDSNSEQSSGLSCPLKQISYSMTDFNKTSVCNNNQSGVCIDKFITCSVKIQNRDNEVAGFFEVELIFLEEGKNRENAFNSSSSKFSLSPMQYKFLSNSIDITSSGQDGLANKEINCFYATTEVPKKKVCV